MSSDERDRPLPVETLAAGRRSWRELVVGLAAGVVCAAVLVAYAAALRRGYFPPEYGRGFTGERMERADAITRVGVALVMVAPVVAWLLRIRSWWTPWPVMLLVLVAVRMSNDDLVALALGAM